MMENVNFEHIYKEINILADKLWIVMDVEPSWYITKFLNSNEFGYFHESSGFMEI